MLALRAARFVTPQIFRKGNSIRASRRIQPITTMTDFKTEGQGSASSPRYIDVRVLRVLEASVPTYYGRYLMPVAPNTLIH